VKIAVVGDAMEDVYWVGTSNRLSPEAPIPVVKITDVFDLPGGAANVAVNLEAMGDVVARLYNSWQPIKNRLMLGEQQLARWDQNDYCSPFGLIHERVKDCDAVVVADYLKGSITTTVVEVLYAQKLHGKRIFIDTKGDPSCWLGVATVVFPNEKEYLQYQSVYEQFELVVRKRGPLGCMLMSRGHFWASYPAEARKVVSVNGAGDTVVAAFVSEWGRCEWQESMANRALRFANTAGAIACEGAYTSVVTRKQVEARRKGIT
jgi:bifunctional ADP-heptose synthase (sugar kinase/adenylyltransferase)